jgi:hypothetical protein
MTHGVLEAASATDAEARAVTAATTSGDDDAPAKP